MDHCDIAERPLLTPSDFTGTPFRLLPRIGDKMYRPSRAVAGTGTAPPPTLTVESRFQREPGVWDWG